MQGRILQEGNVGETESAESLCLTLRVVLEIDQVHARRKEEQSFEASFADGPCLDGEDGRAGCVSGGDGDEVVLLTSVHVIFAMYQDASLEVID